MKTLFLILACVSLTACVTTNTTPYVGPSTRGITQGIGQAKDSVSKAQLSNSDGKQSIEAAKLKGLSVIERLELLRKELNK